MPASSTTIDRLLNGSTSGHQISFSTARSVRRKTRMPMHEEHHADIPALTRDREPVELVREERRPVEREDAASGLNAAQNVRGSCGQVGEAVDDRRCVEQEAQGELRRALEVAEEHHQRSDDEADAEREHRLQHDREREAARPPSAPCAPVDDGEDARAPGCERRTRCPSRARAAITQIVRGIVVDRMSLASRRNARVESETAPLNHIQGSSAVSRNTMYGSSPTAAVEHLGEDEPVDRRP